MDTLIPVTTSQAFEGHRVTEYLGIVRKTLVGGNIGSYETVCEEARAQAFQRMVAHAQSWGANAVIAVHYDATEFMAGVTEVLCYGTAVKIVRAEG